MNGVNKVILIGNTGQDPELRYTGSGAAVANISLATTEKWKDRDSGDMQERTEWHRCVAFGRTAEIIGEYVTKGTPLYVEGKLQTRKWQDRDGNDRWTTEIVIREMQMLGSRGDRQRDDRPQQSEPQAAPPPAEFDDDIPF